MVLILFGRFPGSTGIDAVRPADRISGDVGEDGSEAPVAEERVGHSAAVQEPTVFAERQIPHTVYSDSMGLVSVVQLANERLRGVPGVQAMVLLVGLGEGVRDGPSQNASAATSAAKVALFD